MPTTHSTSGSRIESPSLDADGLQAELRVRPASDLGCALVAHDRDVTVVGHDVVCPDGDCASGCECRSVVETDSGEGSRLVGRTIDDDCVCTVFRNHDCVSSILGVDNGDLVVSLSVVSRETLAAIIDALRDRGATVELRRITRQDVSADHRQLVLDTGSVTEKQRNAIQVAIEEGYYESPRRADLGDLAERLGVSRSAVSQRLSAAEKTLVHALYERGQATGALEDSIDR